MAKRRAPSSRSHKVLEQTIDWAAEELGARILEILGGFSRETSEGVTSKRESPYAILRVEEGAPLAVCEAAYRALAKEYHPDRGGSPARFRRLTDAIERIRDEAKDW